MLVQHVEVIVLDIPITKKRQMKATALGRERQSILMLHLRDGSFTNRSVEQLLKAQFKNYQLEVIDVADVFLKKPLALLLSALYAMWEYRVLPPKWNMLVSSSYGQATIKSWLIKHVKQGNYKFTFQTQSLYDGSTQLVPHFVYTDHTNLANLYYPGFDRRKLRPRVFLALERCIYDNARIVFTRSGHVTRSLIELYECPPEKVICVGAGPNYKHNEHALENDNYANKNILFVGRDWERKGGDDVLKAFELVRETHPDATLTIIGHALPFELPNVTCMQSVPIERMHEHYVKASIFCLPTRLEPFGIAFIEAMNTRLPVVATDIEPIPDFIKDGENGFLVRPGDVDLLAETLVKLLDDPNLCREFGRRGYQIASENYTWSVVGKKFIDI